MRVIKAMTPRKDCRRRSESFGVSRTKGPLPCTVPTTAIAESSQRAAEDSRWPKRKALQTRNGVQRNVQGSPLTRAWRKTPKTIPAVIVSETSKTPASKNWRFVQFRDSFAPHSKSRGVNIKAPAASPSHQVRQMRLNLFHEAKPPSVRLVTPKVAATAVLRIPA